jgi:1-phosphofructokinase/tagatose 6-phosphate kinase
MPFLTIALNPTLQKTLCFSSIIPNTVNRTGIHRLDAAGKGVTTSRVLHQLGKEVVHLTHLGGDLRSLFLSLCAADGIDIHWVENNSQIRFCYTLINDADGSITELVEESEPAGTGTGERLLAEFESLLADRKCLIISGTRAAGLADTLIPFMVMRAKEQGRRVILDVKGTDLAESLRYGPDIIKPNLYEFAATFAPDLVAHNDLSGDEKTVKARIRAVMLELCEKHRCKIVLTRGDQTIWAAEGARFFEAPVAAEKPVNPIGSGDAFTAGLAAALDDGAGFAAAIAEGSRCGALNARLIRPGVIQ